MDSYAPARELYASAGFLTGPFGDYRASPYNCFMSFPLL